MSSVLFINMYLNLNLVNIKGGGDMENCNGCQDSEECWFLNMSGSIGGDLASQCPCQSCLIKVVCKESCVSFGNYFNEINDLLFKRVVGKEF